jgi:murein DD-endopeptidase MepM/ murein hydrolase activator NlpD
VRNRLLPAFVSSLLLVGVLGIAPAPAQDSLEDARAEREELRRQAAEVAAEIDLLGAQDAEVAQALADLEAFVAQTQADIDGAELAIAQAEADAAATDLEVERLDGEIGAAREVVRTFAVTAYVSPGGSDLDNLLSSDDPRTNELRKFFVELAGGNADDAVGELRRLQDDQDALRLVAEEARARADTSRQELEVKLTELRDAIAAQESIRADIERRVAEWEGESAALAAADAEVTAIIQAEEARIEAARQAEIQRLADLERQRLAEEQRLADLQRQRQLAEQPAVTEETPADDDAVVDPPALPPVDAPSNFIWPVNGAVVSAFGFRIHPIFGTQRFHSGIDVNAGSGTPIAAAAGGVVITSGWMDGYGNTVIVDHGGGFATLYAHQSQLAVSVGQSVNQGAIVGYVGSTGWSTGPHLHFEIRIGGAPVDPLGYL